MTDSFVHPMAYQGTYPGNWAGYSFKERLDYGSWLNVPGYHLGIDYNHGTDDQGDPVYAVGNGIVRSAGSSSVYGARITIEHTLSPALAKKLGAPKIFTLYGHVQSIKVKVGQKVSKGQRICSVGKAGTKWPHLHFEMYKPHNYSAVTSRVSRGYPADNVANINKNYYDGYRIIAANGNAVVINAGDEEMFKTDAEVKEAYLLLRGSVATAAERKGWIGQSKQRFFKVGKVEADKYRKQLADVKKALANEKLKPAKEVVKTVEKIVEKPVEVIKEVTVEVPVEVIKEVEATFNWKRVIDWIISQFKRSK